jgi:hypothetical protein
MILFIDCFRSGAVCQIETCLDDNRSQGTLERRQQIPQVGKGLVRIDVEKSASHHLSQSEMASDNGSLPWLI